LVIEHLKEALYHLKIVVKENSVLIIMVLARIISPLQEIP